MLSGMMMQQGVFAAATVSVADGVVTITTEKAGDLKAYLQSASDADKSAIRNATTIVFNGKFNGQDIDALNGDGCCTQSVVDMSDAKFVAQASSSSNTYLYHSQSDRQDKNEGDYCVVGAKKYVSASSRSWISIEESDIPSDKNIVLKSQEEFASYVNNNYEEYIKVPQTYRYYKMVVTYENNNPIKTWVLVEDDSTIPSDATIKNADFDESNLNNRTDYCNDGEYIRFGATFDYYTNPVTFIWQDASDTNKDYSNGDTSNSCYQSLNGAPAPTDEGQSIIVGGTEYVFHDGQWVDPSQAGGNEEYDYTQMHFDYWGSNVKEIITSNHVGENDALPLQLCNNCSNLKKLTLGSGSFNGLGNGVGQLTTVSVLKDVTGLGNKMFYQKSSLTTLSFEEGGTKPLTIESGCFEQCTGLTGTISLPKRLNELGADSFKETTGIEEVEFNEPSNLRTIHSGTFAESGIKRVTIPKSVTLIETNAFQGNANQNSDKYTRLEEVTFQGGNTTPLVIKTGAFQNCVELNDVYVNVKPSERLLICEYDAFDYKGMEGQTVADSEMTTLHFPEDNFDYYAGEWKKGMSIKQSDLNAFKDGIEIKDDQGHVIYAKPDTQNPGAWGQYGFAAIESYGEGNVDGYYHNPNGGNTKYAPANGWQQFAKTASPREVVIPGNVYMTYSTATPYSLPTGIIAFRVTDYKEAETGANGKTINGRLVLKQIDQVPSETGMLLISTDQYLVKPGENNNSTTDVPSKFYFGDPVGTPQIYHYTHGHAGDATSNYLAPAVHGIEVGPVSKGQPNAVTGAIDVNGSPFTHRNFAMNKNTHQFVRVKHIIMPDNRAFLSLPKEMFTNNNESATEGPNPWNTKAGDAFETYETTQYDSQGANTMMFFEYDVEKYGMIWPLAQKEDVTDGIDLVVSNSNTERVQEGIFTLLGVKVAQPTEKGIYIVNGKKVIIK